jgi:kanamycin kinase
MITRGVPGEAVGARIAAGRPVVELFCEVLRLVRAVPVGDCLFGASVEVSLEQLAYLLVHRQLHLI